MLIKSIVIICLMVCCGAVSARVLTRVGIIGGTDAKPGDNPHMCSLRFNGTHQCGASIIGNQWVVTAGHCVVNHNTNVTKEPKAFLLRCGTLLREKPGTDFNISKVILHDMFSLPNYDIALLQVVGKIQLGTPAMDKIALPPQDTDLAPAGAMTTVIGWGLNSTHSPLLPEKLQTLDIPVVDRPTCISDYKNYNPPEYRISDYMFCAGYDEGIRDSCSHDSGSPLKYKNTLVGIVSWGNFCAIPHYPGVYTRVGKFRDWIRIHSSI